MAAGQGYIEFSTGDVLTAAAANGYLASQVVMVFADAAARTTAIATPQEGMISYLKDTNATQYYSGSAWVSIGGAGSPLTTKGDLYTYSTTDARLAVGTNGQVLTADSTAATGIKWAAPAGGGKVLQVVHASTTTQVSTTSTTYADTGLTASITPSSSSSKILVILTQSIAVERSSSVAFARLQLLRNSTVLQEMAGGTYKQRFGAEFVGPTYVQIRADQSIQWLDSPATTSATTYKMQGATGQSSGSTWNAYFQFESAVSTITLLEIGA